MKSQLWVHCACVRPHPSEQETVSKSLGLPDVVHGAADATGQVTRRNFGPGGAEVGEMGQGSRRSLAAAGCPVFPSSSLSQISISFLGRRDEVWRLNRLADRRFTPGTSQEN